MAGASASSAARAAWGRRSPRRSTRPGTTLAGGVDQGGDAAGAGRRAATRWSISPRPPRSRPTSHAAVGAGIPILVGTTGLERARTTRRSITPRGAIPVLQTGNTSLGVTLLAHLVREAAARLGPDWDIEIVEMHHRLKVDAPSGTALLLGEAAAEGRGVELADDSERGRDGITGARGAGRDRLRLACAAAPSRASTA